MKALNRFLWLGSAALALMSSGAATAATLCVGSPAHVVLTQGQPTELTVACQLDPADATLSRVDAVDWQRALSAPSPVFATVLPSAPLVFASPKTGTVTGPAVTFKYAVPASTPAGSFVFRWVGTDSHVPAAPTTMSADFDARVEAGATLSVNRLPGTIGNYVTDSLSTHGIDCGRDAVQLCSASYPIGTAVALQATATTNYRFTGWSGGCTGTGVCSVTMNADTAVTANFESTSSACGSVSGSTQLSSATLTSQTANMCASGVPTNINSSAGLWTWSCGTSTCKAGISYNIATAITGGTANPSSVSAASYGDTIVFAIAPTTAGSTPAVVNGTGFCGGSVSGTSYVVGPVTMACTAAVNYTQQPVSGVCGTANNAIVSTSATDGEAGTSLSLCAAGTAVPGAIAAGVGYPWTCQHVAGAGADASCESYLGWDVTLVAGVGGSLSCNRQNPPAWGTTTTLTAAANSSITRKVGNNHALSCTASPASGYTLGGVTASGTGCTYSAGSTNAITGGGCTFTANFQQQGQITGCLALPGNWILVGPLSSLVPAGAVTVDTLAAGTGRSYSFTLDSTALSSALGGYTYGWQFADGLGGSKKYSVSECPGPVQGATGAPFAAPVLNQVAAGLDVNGDGRLDSCVGLIGYHARFRTGSAGYTYYSNTANLSSQNTCFLPTTDANGNPATYYYNVENLSSTADQGLQLQFIRDVN